MRDGREHLDANEILHVMNAANPSVQVFKQQGETKLVALEVAAFEATPERREVRLKVDARSAPAGVIRELAGVVREFPGEAPVYVDLVTSLGSKLRELGPDYRVDPQPDFFASVRHLLGAAAIQ